MTDVGKTLKILLVDDEPAILELTRIFLALDPEFDIDTATSGTQGLLKLKTAVYDAIVSDYQMPGMNGIGFLKEVRSRYTIPFILFTGRGREEVAIEAINSGADFYIKKGGELEAQYGELTNAIRQAAARHQAELERVEVQERYRSLYDHVLSMVYIQDMEGNIIDANPTALRLMGYGREEAIGLNIMDLIAPEQVPLAFAIVQEIVRTGIQKQFVEFQLRRKDGEYIDIEIIGSLLRHDGKPYAIQGMGRDITEKKRALKELQQERDRAQKYVDLAGFIFLAFDEGARIILLNKQGCQTVGLADPPIGRNWLDFVPERIHPEMREVIRQLNSGESEAVKYFEKPIRTVSGKERLIAWHNTVLRDDTGKIVGTLSSGEDITESRMTMEAIIETNKKLNLLAGITLHDVQNQIILLNGLIQRARHDLGRNVSTENLAVMQRATERIQSLLNFAREYQSAGKTPPGWQHFGQMPRRPGVQF